MDISSINSKKDVKTKTKSDFYDKLIEKLENNIELDSIEKSNLVNYQIEVENYKTNDKIETDFKNIQKIFICHKYILTKCIEPILIENRNLIIEIKNEDLVDDFNYIDYSALLNKIIQDQIRILNSKSIIDGDKQNIAILKEILIKLIDMQNLIINLINPIYTSETHDKFNQNQKELKQLLCDYSEFQIDGVLIKNLKYQNFILSHIKEKNNSTENIIKYQENVLENFENDSINFENIKLHYDYLNQYLKFSNDSNNLFDLIFEQFRLILNQMCNLIKLTDSIEVNSLMCFINSILDALQLNKKHKVDLIDIILDIQRELLNNKNLSLLDKNQELLFSLVKLNFNQDILEQSESFELLIQKQEFYLENLNSLKSEEQKQDLKDIIKLQRLILVHDLADGKTIEKFKNFFALPSFQNDSDVSRFKKQLEFLNSLANQGVLKSKSLINKLHDYNTEVVKICNDFLKSEENFENVLNIHQLCLKNLNHSLFDTTKQVETILKSQKVMIESDRIKDQFLEKLIENQSYMLNSLDFILSKDSRDEIVKHQTIIVKILNANESFQEYDKNILIALNYFNSVFYNLNSDNYGDFIKNAVFFQKRLIDSNLLKNDYIELIISQQNSILDLVENLKNIPTSKESLNDLNELIVKHQSLILENIEEHIIKTNLIDKGIVDKIMDYQNVLLSNWSLFSNFAKKDQIFKLIVGSHKDILQILDKEIDRDLIKKILNNQSILVSLLSNQDIENVFETLKECKSFLRDNLLSGIDVPEDLMRDASVIFDSLSELNSTIINPIFDVKSFSDFKQRFLTLIRNKRFFKIACVKAVKIIIDLALFMMSLFSNQQENFNYYFGYVYYIYLYAYLFTCSLSSINNFLIYYNTSFDREVTFMLSLDSLKNISTRTEWYGNLFQKILYIPNEILYSSVSYLTKYAQVIYLKELLWRLNYNFINFLVLFLKVILLSGSIVITSFAIYYIKVNGSKISALLICCLILLCSKLIWDFFDFFYFKIVYPKELRKDKVGYFNLIKVKSPMNKSFVKFIRHWEHLSEGCVLKENCKSFNLEHIVTCHSELKSGKKTYPDIKRFFCSKSLNDYAIGFYTVNYDEAIKISREGFSLQNGDFGKGVYFTRSIDNCIKSNSILTYKSFVVALVNLGKKQVINYEQAKMHLREKKKLIQHMKRFKFDSLFIKADTNTDTKVVEEKERFLVLDPERVFKFVVCLNVKDKNQSDEISETKKI